VGKITTYRMTALNIDSTKTSPFVFFTTDGDFTLSGRSLEEWPQWFYGVFEWIEGKKFDKILFKVSLTFLNTLSTSLLNQLFSKIKAVPIIKIK
jgi:hypothetical protein